MTEKDGLSYCQLAIYQLAPGRKDFAPIRGCTVRRSSCLFDRVRVSGWPCREEIAVARFATLGQAMAGESLSRALDSYVYEEVAQHEIQLPLVRDKAPRAVPQNTTLDNSPRR